METLSDPLQLVEGHRVFEGDNVRLLRSDSGDTSEGVAGCFRPRPRPPPPPPRGDDNARSSMDFFREKHRKPGILHWQKPGKNVQEVVEIAWVSLLLRYEYDIREFLRS